MDFLQSLKISATGLTAHRAKMNLISQNLANTDTTRTEEGGPYKRKMIVLEEKPLEDFTKILTDTANKRSSGVQVSEIVQSQEDFNLVYNPSHPDADPNTGYVKMPNINLLTEIADMIVARRAYDANVTAMTNTKSMILKALEIGK